MNKKILKTILFSMIAITLLYASSSDFNKNVQKTYYSFLEDTNSQIDYYTKKEIDNKFAELTSSAQENEVTIEAVNTLIEQNKNSIVELNSTINTQTNELATINNTVTNMQSNLSNYALKTSLDVVNQDITDITTAISTNSTNIENLNTNITNFIQTDSYKIRGFEDEAVSDWDADSYLEIDLSDSAIAAMQKAHTIKLIFGTGSQTVGGAGQPHAMGYYLVSTWIAAFPIIDGKTAYYKTDLANKKFYIWCDENPSLSLRVIEFYRDF